MDAVLDTNVIVSGLLTPHGPCGHILDMVFTFQVRPAFDQRLFEEYDRVLGRPKFGFNPATVRNFLGAFQILGMPVAPPRIAVRLPDPGDLPVLECALVIKGNSLVTGNKKHFPASACSPARVYSPREFLNRALES